MENKIKSFEEFVMSRVEEIVENDPVHQELDKKIALLESQVIDKIPIEIINDLRKIEHLKVEQMVNDYLKIYIGAFNDRLKAS